MENHRNKDWRYKLLLGIVIVALMTGCADLNKPAVMSMSGSGYLAGYLSTEALPDSIALIPPPPAPDSIAFALDEEISRSSFALRDTPRWLLAVSDADPSFPHAAGTFSCALNAPITEELTPYLYRLLHRSLTDLVKSTFAAKDHYKRGRPFVMNKKPICTPEDQARLEKNGSYPSGHATAGWGWALILSEISPEQTDAILARGLAFGDSRNVCNVHWHSDVVQARSMAAGTVARLHAEPAFRADIETARGELAAVRSKGLKPTRDCNTEATALALQPLLTP